MSGDVELTLSGDCPECGDALRLRRRRSDGRGFLGCQGYPSCSFVVDRDEIISEMCSRLESALWELGSTRQALNKRDEKVEELFGTLSAVRGEMSRTRLYLKEVTANLADARRERDRGYVDLQVARRQLASAKRDLAVEKRKRAPPRSDAAALRESITSIRRQLRSIIATAHPDRWPQHAELSHAVTVRLNGLRDSLEKLERP